MSNRKSLFHLRSLPPAVAALAAVGLSGSALAQVGNPTTGATLYKTAVAIPNGVPLACENCHGAATVFNVREGTDPAVIVGRMSAAIAAPGNSKSMNQYAVWSAQMRADVASYIASATSASPPPPPLTLPPGTPAPTPAPAPAPTPAPPSTTPTTSPDVARFSSVEIGKESATSGVLVTNSTSAAVTFATPAFVPPTGKVSEFFATIAPQGTTNCVPGYTLQAGTSCSFGVRFAPMAAGVRTETWSVKFTNNVPARDVTLEGTAIASTAAAGSTAPTGSSAANAPSDGGGGALGLGTLFGLAGLAALGRLRRRINQ